MVTVKYLRFCLAFFLSNGDRVSRPEVITLISSPILKIGISLVGLSTLRKRNGYTSKEGNSVKERFFCLPYLEVSSYQQELMLHLESKFFSLEDSSSFLVGRKANGRKIYQQYPCLFRKPPSSQKTHL